MGASDTSNFIVTDRMLNMLKEGDVSELSFSVLDSDGTVTISFYVDDINAENLHVDQNNKIKRQQLVSKCSEPRPKLEIFVAPDLGNQTKQIAQ